MSSNQTNVDVYYFPIPSPTGKFKFGAYNLNTYYKYNEMCGVNRVVRVKPDHLLSLSHDIREY